MSKKTDSLEALRDAINIRKRVMNALKFLILQAQKRAENLAPNSEELRIERFNMWLIKEECNTIASTSADISRNLRTANTIFPTYMSEYEERRNFMNRALAACNVLQDELQYVADAIYADKNKFTALVLDIETLFRKIKSIRQADNRFLRQLKER